MAGPDLDKWKRQLEQDGPTYGQAKQGNNALRRLEQIEALGDLRPAEREKLAQLRAQQSANDQAIGETGARYRGALQGNTFNWADEIGGMFGGDMQGIRDRNRIAQEAYPDQYNSGRTMGGAFTGAALGLATGGLGTGPTLLSTMARGAGLGGAEGALWGAGRGEGAMGKATAGLKDGAIGLGVGALAPAAVAGTGKALGFGRDLVTGGIDSAINRGNPRKAGRAIVQSMMDSGRTPQQIDDALRTAALQGQPEYRLMDTLGIAGQRRASGVVRSGGPGADELAEFLRQRQTDASDRMGAFVDDAFGTRGTTAAQTVDSLKAARGAAADAAYGAARGNAAPVNVTPVMDDINELLRSNVSVDGGMTGLADTAIGKRIAAIGRQLSNGNYQAIDFNDVLETKMEMGRAIDVMKRRGGVPPAFAKVYSQLDAALEASSDMYRTANDGFRQASRTIDAVDTGKTMATRGRAADNVPAFQGMPPEQQSTARVGYGDQLLTELERNRARAPDVSRLVTSTKRAAESDAMAIDPRLFADRTAREGEMFETFNRALGGSRTADNLQDVADLSPLADAGRAVRDAAGMNFGSALNNAANAIAPYVTGKNEATRTLIARALMSNDPMAILTPALRRQESSTKVRRIVEGILRGGERGDESITFSR